MKIFIVTHKVPGYPTRVCSVHSTLEAGKAEADRLDAASSWASALVVEREMELPDARTPEQRRWLDGYGSKR